LLCLRFLAVDTIREGLAVERVAPTTHCCCRWVSRQSLVAVVAAVGGCFPCGSCRVAVVAGGRILLEYYIIASNLRSNSKEATKELRSTQYVVRSTQYAVVTNCDPSTPAIGNK
jgi:hypothetical protein